MMLSLEVQRRIQAFFMKQLNHPLSQKQMALLHKIIQLAAEKDTVLDKNGTLCIDAVIGALRSFPSNAKDKDINQKAQATLKTIDQILKQQALDKFHKNNTVGFTSDDKLALYRHKNNRFTWLTDEHIEAFTPKDTSKFVVLPPTSPNLLMITEEDAQPITIQSQLNDPNITSMVMPVGPGHWRLVHIEKTTINNKPALSVNIFDSFGKQSASQIDEAVKTWLQSQTTLPITMGYDEPKKKQTDGFSCGDFVIGKMHQLAKQANAPHNQNFVAAFETGKPLRSELIQASKAATVSPSQPTQNKWFSFRKEQTKTETVKQQPKPTKENLIAYHNQDGSTVLVDKKTQIERDEQLAKQLQDELNDEQGYRCGPQ